MLSFHSYPLLIPAQGIYMTWPLACQEVSIFMNHKLGKKQNMKQNKALVVWTVANALLP